MSGQQKGDKGTPKSSSPATPPNEVKAQTKCKANGSRNTQECLRLDRDKLLQDIQNLPNSWKRRKLTLFGRITILRTLAMSKCN